MLSLVALVVLVYMLVVLLLVPRSIFMFKSMDADMHKCPSRRCGTHKISYPFMLQDSPPHCGDQRYNLSCVEVDEQLILYLKSGKFRVQSINYNNYTIRLLDANLADYYLNYAEHHHNYSSQLPPYSSTSYNSGATDPYGHSFYRHDNLVELVKQVVLYVRCPRPLESSSLHVSDDESATCCINGSYAIGSEYGYYVYGFEKSIWDLGIGDSCRIEWMYPTSWPAADNNSNSNISCTDIRNMLFYGFELSWAVCYTIVPYTAINFKYIATINEHNSITCAAGNYLNKFSLAEVIVGALLLIILYVAGRAVIGAPFLIVFCMIYKWPRRHLSLYGNIEDFLRSDNNIMPIRYSYKDIKRITGGFKTKLGNGGYGTVFRGKLRSGRLVAIKVLNTTKSNNDQDFINEVATIGRIHHVNVVQLIGFCVEGSKRALIYELMQNGSLEKYIFSSEESASLSCQKLYSISLGVARGIEYLHNGCDMKILHFDIKPHNILLDENFNPKVSDFGLARLYPTDNSIVSLTAARGTIGYMAPELFYRNVGSISNKADVYSFGMLLMEIAGRRKNLNALNEHSSQIYYPFWVYDQLHDGKEIAIENDTDEEMRLAKRMMIVALWCIQTKPSDRPSMDKVVEMLEQDEDLLELPRKPYFYDPNDVAAPAAEDHVADHSSSSLSIEMTVSHSKGSLM